MSSFSGPMNALRFKQRAMDARKMGQPAPDPDAIQVPSVAPAPAAAPAMPQQQDPTGGYQDALRPSALGHVYRDQAMQARLAVRNAKTKEERDALIRQAHMADQAANAAISGLPVRQMAQTPEQVAAGRAHLQQQADQIGQGLQRDRGQDMLSADYDAGMASLPPSLRNHKFSDPMDQQRYREFVQSEGNRPTADYAGGQVTTPGQQVLLSRDQLRMRPAGKIDFGGYDQKEAQSRLDQSYGVQNENDLFDRAALEALEQRRRLGVENDVLPQLAQREGSRAAYARAQTEGEIERTTGPARVANASAEQAKIDAELRSQTMLNKAKARRSEIVEPVQQDLDKINAEYGIKEKQQIGDSEIAAKRAMSEKQRIEADAATQSAAAKASLTSQAPAFQHVQQSLMNALPAVAQLKDNHLITYRQTLDQATAVDHSLEQVESALPSLDPVQRQQLADSLQKQLGLGFNLADRPWTEWLLKGDSVHQSPQRAQFLLYIQSIQKRLERIQAAAAQ